MSNKQWLLNHVAIRKAKQCIVIIEKELGVRLKLTHPLFLEMIKEYAEMTDSVELQQSFSELEKIAGVGIAPEIKEEVNKVVEFSHRTTTPHTKNELAANVGPDESISYRGKAYKRFNDAGKEFKGLYRGQARYA